MHTALTILVWVLIIWGSLFVVAGVLGAIGFVIALVKTLNEPHPKRAVKKARH